MMADESKILREKSDAARRKLMATVDEIVAEFVDTPEVIVLVDVDRKFRPSGNRESTWSVRLRLGHPDYGHGSQEDA